MPENSTPPDADTPVPAVRLAASVVVTVAGGWFLLAELTTLFRPLLFAVLSLTP